MANRKGTPENGLEIWTLDTTGQVVVGNAADSTVSSMVLEFVGSGSTVLRKRVTGSAIADASALTTWYEDMQAGAEEVDAGTAITGTKLIKVYVDGCELILDHTASGTTTVKVRRLKG